PAVHRRQPARSPPLSLPTRRSSDLVSSLLQRMGRTGRRAGTVANTTFFCETDDGMLQAVAMVEHAKAHWVEAVELSDRAWPVLRSEEHTSELQSRENVVCRLLL